MWPTGRTRSSSKSSEDDRADLNANGPIVNNPDPGAVQLTVKLESVALPVFFPNYIPPKSLLDYADPKYSYKQYNNNIICIIHYRPMCNQRQQLNVQEIASKITQNSLVCFTPIF